MVGTALTGALLVGLPFLAVMLAVAFAMVGAERWRIAVFLGAWVPPMELCTDNAAMIAAAARFLEPLPYPAYLALDAAARLV